MVYLYYLIVLEKDSPVGVYRVCERHEVFVEADNASDAIEKAAQAGSRLVFADESVLAEGYDNSNSWVETYGEAERYKNFQVADFDDDSVENEG